MASIAADSLNARLAWVGSIKTPNLVCHGQFRSTISATLGTDHRVTHTGKVPQLHCVCAAPVVAVG